jgi:hypothetical protein
MGLKDDKDPVWTALVRVCDYISSLSMTSNHYQTNILFKPFYNHGWPHYDNMALLMPSKVKGTNAHYPSQLPLDFKLMPPIPSIPLSSSDPFPPSLSSSRFNQSLTLTPFNISSTYNSNIASSKCKVSPLKVSMWFSGSSKKRKALSEAKALQGTLDHFLNVMDQCITPSSFVPLPPPSALYNTIATNHFLDYIEACNKCSDVWLSNEKAVHMVQLFQSDEKMGAYYKSVSKRENDDLLRRWVEMMLDLKGA